MGYIPLAGRQVVALYSAQSVQGTAVTPATPFGNAEINLKDEAGLVVVKSIGTPLPIALKPGVNVPTWAVNIGNLQTKAWLLNAVRTNGALPWLTIGGGYQRDGTSPTKYAKQMQDCKVGQFEVSLEGKGGPLKYNASGIGGLITVLTSLVPSNLSDMPFMGWEGVMTKGGGAYEIASFRFSGNHNLDAVSPLPGSTPAAFKRGWTYLVEGDQDITGQVTAYGQSGIDFQADTIASFPLQIALASADDGTNTVTIQLTGVKFGSEEYAGAPSGKPMFTLPFTATDWSVA